MAIRLKEYAAASIPTPPSGTAFVFIDSATGEPSYKDDTGAVATLVGADGTGFADGDYGDVVISGGVTVLAIDPAVLTAAARTVTDDATVGAMVDTLGGAASTGTGGLVRATAPTIAGATFSADISVPDEAYDATAWNGSLEVPTKNALRDKIETLTGVSDGDKGDVTVSGGGTVWTIDDEAVTYAKIQDVGASRMLGNFGGSPGPLSEKSAADVLAWLGSSPSPGAGLPYMYPFGDAIDDPVNDNFRGGAIDTSGARFSGASAWTADNIGASTVVQADGRLWLTAPASASVQVRGYYQPVPSGNWCIRMHVTMRPLITDTTQKAVGMYLRDSTSGKEEFWGITQNIGAPTCVMWGGQMTDNTTFFATRIATDMGTTFFPTYLEIEYDGTNYTFRTGWADQPLQRHTTAWTFAKTNFLTAAADGIGVFALNNQSIATTLIARGFYRVPVSSVL